MPLHLGTHNQNYARPIRNTVSVLPSNVKCIFDPYCSVCEYLLGPKALMNSLGLQRRWILSTQRLALENFYAISMHCCLLPPQRGVWEDSVGEGRTVIPGEHSTKSRWLISVHMKRKTSYSSYMVDFACTKRFIVALTKVIIIFCS